MVFANGNHYHATLHGMTCEIAFVVFNPFKVRVITNIHSDKDYTQ